MMLIFSSADLLLPNGSPGSIPGQLRRSFEQETVLDSTTARTVLSYVANHNKSRDEESNSLGFTATQIHTE